MRLQPICKKAPGVAPAARTLAGGRFAGMRYRRVTSRYVRLVPLRESLTYGDLFRAMARVAPVAPLHWRPAADVCEAPSRITVTLDVAGLDEEAIDVGLYEDALVIEGTRTVEGCGSDGFYHAAEIRQGQFHVEVLLPAEVDHERVQATYERGLLRIDLPKVVARPRTGRARESTERPRVRR